MGWDKLGFRAWANSVFDGLISRITFACGGSLHLSRDSIHGFGRRPRTKGGDDSPTPVGKPRVRGVGKLRGLERLEPTQLVVGCTNGPWPWATHAGVVRGVGVARGPRPCGGRSDQSSAEARIVTRAGRRALESGSLQEILAAERIGLALHPLLEGKVRPIFLLGDYETAAFKAMKEVEVRVRELAKLPNDLIGVALMRQAFNPTSGPLTDASHEGGERQARSDLFSGAIGSFKNPTSHRPVTYTDPTEASEVVLLADLLMRILDSLERSTPNSE
jgi:uncharacterized protein (TIGR02391 family)